MEAAGNNSLFFKRLYGEGKVDLDVLFHVIDEDITLPDLVGEAVTVSDSLSLIAKTENLLNAISGEKNNLAHYFAQASTEEKAMSGDANGVTYAFEALDEAIIDLDYIFQIRHAVVHDVFSYDGPIKRALKKEKLWDVAASCVAFLLLSDRAFFYHLGRGKISPDATRPQHNARMKKLENEATKTMRQLKRRFPKADKNLVRLDKSFNEIFDSLAALANDMQPDNAMSRDIVDAFFTARFRTYRALRIDAAFANKGS
jgi:hypothetical protein